MDDDNEVLDWGHEDETAVAVHGSDKRTFHADDAEDAVSLGGDEEDEFLTYQSRVPQDVAQRAQSPQSTPKPKQDVLMGRGDSPRTQPQEQHAERASEQPFLPTRPLVHALPPKPVVSTVSFVYPSYPSTIEATAMVSRVDRDKRNGTTSSKPTVYDHNDPLPPGWEVKHPRNGRGVYYYNIHTQESTWTRPTLPSREMRGERVDRRDDPLDRPLSTRNGDSLISRPGRSESDDMSYDDRHYRPGDSTRREERSSRSSQRTDSYVPDSYSPNHRNSRPSSPRARDRDPSPPLRRPSSPNGSYGDRDDVQRSYRETPVAVLSSQNRARVAHDDVPPERTRERRQRDDPLPSETQRRNPPRDTDRSSTTRPRSPASYPRGSQESASTTPRSSIKLSQPVSEATLASRKSRFSQIDAPLQPSHRQAESRDVGIRRARTDNISRSTRYTDDCSSSRPMLDVRGDDDTLTHPASDAQRLRSRKKSFSPPQDEAFLPSTRSAPGQRGIGHPPGPVGSTPLSVPENRYSSRVALGDTVRDSVRRSPSPPQPRPPLAERGDPDRGRSRWSKPQPNRPPSQMDSRNTHESSRGRAHDVAMDVDDAPPPRSSDPPIKQVPPRRPALQDEVPRYPRAMLNSDNDGTSRGGIREARDGMDARHRSALDGPSRFGPSRDRPAIERHFADQTVSQQKEPNRGVETRTPPSGSNVKLSGTNNIPIGIRNKFINNAPPPSVPPSSTPRAPAVASGSNGEPVAPRRDRVSRDHERPPHLDGTTTDRGAPTELARREDIRRSPPSHPRALPPTEPAAPPTRPSRAALGISRFGPPIVKENIEPMRPQKDVSLDSLSSEHIPEGSPRATPPPPSRESSMVSVKDMVGPPSRPSHLPPRPASPPRGYRFRSGDPNKPLHRPNVVVPDSRGNEMNTERPKPPSPAPRKRAMDTYPSDPAPAPRDNRATYSPERSRTNLHDSEAGHHVAPSLQPPPVVQEEERERAPPAMHPERALMLQVNGLPPRPPSMLGRARSGRGIKRDRHDDRDDERAEPLRGNSKGRYGSVSPVGERRCYPEDDRPVGYGGGGGASLLERLTLDEGTRVNSPSLRERVQLPFKRDRDEMLASDLAFDPEGDDYDGSKRARRRGTRVRRGRS